MQMIEMTAKRHPPKVSSGKDSRIFDLRRGALGVMDTRHAMKLDITAFCFSGQGRRWPLWLSLQPSGVPLLHDSLARLSFWTCLSMHGSSHTFSLLRMCLLSQDVRKLQIASVYCDCYGHLGPSPWPFEGSFGSFAPWRSIGRAESIRKQPSTNAIPKRFPSTLGA